MNVCVCMHAACLSEHLTVLLHICTCGCEYAYSSIHRTCLYRLILFAERTKDANIPGIISRTNTYIFVLATISHLSKQRLLREMVHSRAGASYIKDEPGIACYAEKEIITNKDMLNKVGRCHKDIAARYKATND